MNNSIMGVFKKGIGILMLTFMSGLLSCTATKSLPDSSTTGNLIIYYEPGAGNEELLDAAKKYGSEVLYIYKNINGIAVTVPEDRTAADAIEYYGKVNGVLSVVQDRMLQLD